MIGQYLSQQLFGEEDPIGKYILIKRMPVQIVGVLEARGTAPTGENLDDRIVMPLTTVMTKVRNDPRYLSLFRIRFEDQDNLYRHVEKLRLFLRARHGILQDEPDDFRIISPKEIIKFLVAITGSLVAFLGITGIIALLVAGFVLANLFLLSVQERTREIGIRRSVGARKRDILLQFLGESVVITTAGGIAGVCPRLGCVETPHVVGLISHLFFLEGICHRALPVLSDRHWLRPANRHREPPI